MNRKEMERHRGWHAKVAAKRRADFEATTLEQRRKFIQLLHEEVDLGEAAKQIGITLDSALEVYRINNRRVLRHVLTPSKEVL